MKLHSVVDIITNSSTVIFTTVTDDAIENTKLGIEQILLAAGVTQDVDELFDFSIAFEEGWLEDTKSDWEYEKSEGYAEDDTFEDYLNSMDFSEGDHKYVKVTKKGTNEVVTLDYFTSAYEWDSVFS